MQLIRFKNQRGDTIVEVLIAVAVLSAVLATSYAIVGRNTKSYQQVNEHTEALKLAETQLERLGSIAKGDDTGLKDSVFTGTAPFCIGAGTVTAGNCTAGPDGRYRVRVERPNPDRFEAVVEWDGINSGTDRVSLSYRISQ